jgi:hypothetical protein
MKQIIKDQHGMDATTFISMEFIKKEMKNTLTVLPGKDEFTKDPNNSISVCKEFVTEMNTVGNLVHSVEHFDQSVRQQAYDLATYTGVAIPTEYKDTQLRSTDLRAARDRLFEDPEDEIYKGLQFGIGKYANSKSEEELRAWAGDEQGNAQLGPAEMQGVLYNMEELHLFPEITNIDEAQLIAQEISLAGHYVCTAMIKMSKPKADECLTRIMSQLKRRANGCIHIDYCVHA